MKHLEKLRNCNKYITHNGDIESSDNIKIRDKKIIFGDINTSGKIISYEDIIVIGNINAKYLLVSGDLICIGEINVNEIDIEGDVRCLSRPQCDILEIGGNITYIENINKTESSNKLDVIHVDKDIYNNKLIIEQIENIKTEISKDLIQSKFDYSIENICKLFNILSNVFVEYKQYSKFIETIVQIEDNCKTLEEYLYVSYLQTKVPTWLLSMTSVKSKLDQIYNIDINTLNMDVNDEDDFIKICSYLFNSKDLLGEKYEFFKYLVVRLKEDNENKIIQNNEAIKASQEIISTGSLYDTYVNKENDREIIQAKIKRIEDKKIVLDVEEGVEASLLDVYDVGDRTTYKVGEILTAYILNVTKEGEKVELDLYRNSRLYAYNHIKNLNIENSIDIKKSNIYVIANEEVCITSYIENEDVIVKVEEIIRNSMKVKSVKILNALSFKERNIKKILEISAKSITNNENSNFTIEVGDIEEYKRLNKLIEKYKEVSKALRIEKISVNMVSIRSRYNLYTKKSGKLIKGILQSKDDNKYIITIEGNVKAFMRYSDINKIYNVGDEILAKVDTVSLDDECVYIRASNIYKQYIYDLVEYKLKEQGLENKVKFIAKRNNSLGLDIILDNVNNTLDKEDIDSFISYIESKIDKSKDSIQLKENNDTEIMDKEIKGKLQTQDKKTTTSQIINLFNKKKRECGVPEINLLKYDRIEGYKTLIICSNMSINKDVSNLLSLEYDLEIEVNGEKVKIGRYNNDISLTIAELLEVKTDKVEIDKNRRSIKITLEKEKYDSIKKNEKNEIKLLTSLFPYYNISFESQNIKENSVNTKADINDDIMKMLFK